MQLKKRIIAAAVIALIIIALYPVLNGLAAAERGYDAFGGEELALIFGLAIAAIVLFDGGTDKKRRAARPKANRPTTESEQSNNHFDA